MAINIFPGLSNQPGVLAAGLAIPEREGLDQDITCLILQLLNGAYACQESFDGI